MMHSFPIKAALLGSIIFCACGAVMAKEMRTTLKKGMLSKQLVVAASSNGGHTGKCLKLAITNTSANSLSVFIDPALIFIPEDTIYPNLVTLGNETLALAPSETKVIDLDSYCGKSYAYSPRAKLNYKFASLGDSIMV